MKKYIGSDLKAPWTNKQFVWQLNRDKSHVVRKLAKAVVNAFVKLALASTDAGYLERIIVKLSQRVEEIDANRERPNFVLKTIWTGRVVCEHTRCSKPSCKCQSRKKEDMHGPYFYCHTARRVNPAEQESIAGRQPDLKATLAKR